MTHFQVRDAFLKFFERNGHRIVPSSRLVPENDDTLLFANAGMNQFKNTFLGLEKREYTRATSSQKCVRAGGKHNDLENVGFTARHHTFFEMLGNFSFGDYFKKDAIRFAWAFLTEELKIPKDKLHVTVHISDDEAAEIWMKQENVPANHISRFDADNFWKMGDTGPCGPCTEMFYDHGAENGCGKADCKVGCSCDRYVEIWNLVFMQFLEFPAGTLKPLPSPSVDTGSGLERVCAVMQGTPNNYDTDVFKYLIDKSTQISGKEYKSTPEVTTAMRVLADHARASAFLLTDGVIPSNEGRGYVLRRIMRRGIRFGRKLSADKSMLVPLVNAVIDNMGVVYPDLIRQRESTLANVAREEERFLQTLDQGTRILDQEIALLLSASAKKLNGETAFKLYDTYGFPVDLTRLMAAEKGLELDETDFETHMEKARVLSQASWKGKASSEDELHMVALVQGLKPTEFKGYEAQEHQCKVLKISTGAQEVLEIKKGQQGLVILDQTPFYATSGGQVGDRGTLKTASCTLEVVDCRKEKDVHIHFVYVVDGTLKVGEHLTAVVNISERRDIAANHSATHLLHAALRNLLGKHIQQAGSLVEPDRLRFDFTHPEPLKPDQIDQLEQMVNTEIGRGVQLETKNSSYKDAVEKEGAMALFGEKYGDIVRVIRMGDFSTELCGGTHVRTTSDIRIFKIVSEGGVSAGVRRMEAITGRRAFEFLNKATKETLAARSTAGLTSSWTKYLGIEPSEVQLPELPGWIEDRKDQLKGLEKQIKRLKSAQIDVAKIVSEAKVVNGIRLVTADLDIDDRDVLSDITFKIRDQLKSGVAVVIGRAETALPPGSTSSTAAAAASNPILVVVTPDLTSKYNAGKILKEFAGILGGKGGGRPDFAQGAGSDLTKLPEAWTKLQALI